VITMGHRGALLSDTSGDCEQIPPFAVSAIDATAAGDAFAAALGVAFAETGDIKRAVAWGSAAGALAASRLGAQQAMPTRDEVLQLIEQGQRLAAKTPVESSEAAGGAEQNP
jgi:ribokinase